MKRLLGVLFIGICLYAVFVDLTRGTLPKNNNQTEEIVEEVNTASIPYEEVTISRGDTLLTIIEKRDGFPSHISINQMIEDFMVLNNGVKPEMIQPGQTYKIPVYSREH